MMNGPYCVVVRFMIKAEHTGDFRAAILENARLSLDNEPGCRVFDVCDSDEGKAVLLYEIYESEQAFQAHLQATHFLSFDARTKPWVQTKTVNTYTLVSERRQAA